MCDRTCLLRILAATALLALSGCVSMGSDASSRPLRPVAYVDLPRYMGGWFVIANIPYSAEKDCFDSVEGYALRPDGRIENKFACRDDSFDAPMKPKLKTVATVHDRTSNAEWRVPFFKVIRVKYLVIDLDPDYRWAVIGHPSRRYGWVISRTASLPDDTYSGILQRLREQGYDTAKFVKVPQWGGDPRRPAGAGVPTFRPVPAQQR
jgi:apolipoprotein D and lipocalin family protein